MQNDTSASTLQPPEWRKSSYSGPQGGDCVEVATLDTGTIAVRDSKDPHGPVLVHTHTGMSAFLRGIKTGQLHDPTV